ncbi:hypothetical protein EON65_33605 [archaeon]|nr:MAG: hypothetical protein EON65_33605 [archaeon]
MEGLYNAYLSLRKLIARWQAKRKAIQSSNALSSFFQPTLPPIELLPGLVFGYCSTYFQFQLFASSLASTYFHPCGTLPMRVEANHEKNRMNMEDEGSTYETSGKEKAVEAKAAAHNKTAFNNQKGWVVDEQLRVRGVQGLRIADASVIPSVPSSPIAATCMCVGVAAGMFIIKQEGFASNW